MEYTKNLNLKKPDVNEYYDIEKNNENMDLIDTAVGELNKNINTIDSKKLTTDGRITEIRWNNNNYIEFIVDGKIVEVSRRN